MSLRVYVGFLSYYHDKCMSITREREAYRPFEYPEFDPYFQAALGSVWRPEKVAMEKDIGDFARLGQKPKDLIIGITTGFTLAECHIGDYWSDYVTKMFPKHEIVNACRGHSFFESIHSAAYNYLADSLNINDHEHFLANPVAKTKLSFFESHPMRIESVAIFSGIEYVSLFCSFAILLSFAQVGQFRGMSQIISWSALDEDLHADMGTKLFLQYVDENGDSEIDHNAIYESFDILVENEIDFIKSIWTFEEEEKLNGLIDLKTIIAYIKHRANEQLGNLGLHSNRYDYDLDLALDLASWFHPLYKGYSSADFFAEREEGGSYVAKPLQNFESVDLSNLNLELNLTLEV